MHEELDNFERNQVWELEEPPPNCKPNGTKWVWKNKEVENGEVVRNKARLVAQGYSQRRGYLFLGLQIKQGKEGTFVHQAKYMKKIFKKSRWMTRSPCRH
jgi:hypothetical protein